jgi:hypothetical protein
MYLSLIAALAVVVAVVVLRGTPSVPVARQAPAAPKTLTRNDVVREYGYVPMKDGTKLAYVMYRPRADGRYPSLLRYDPYMSDGIEFNDARPYVEHGYAFVGANVRGSGCSEGVFSLFQPAEGDDGAQMIEWMAAQGWSNGAVGMVGNSYPGHTQIMTAAYRPKHLKAIAAGGLTANIGREGFRPAGMLNAGFASRWAQYAQPRLARLGAENRMKWGDTTCAAIRARQQPNPTFRDSINHVTQDEYWQTRALESYIDRVDVPTMIIQGWQDHQTASSGGQFLYKKLRAANRKLVLQSGGHEVYSRDIVSEQVLRWMDRWLKGERNGIEKEPAVTIWWEVQDVYGKSTPNWTTTHASWPAPETTWSTLYLTADGKLAAERPAANPPDKGARPYTYMVGTELVGNDTQFSVPPEPTGVLTYRTAPMTEDTAILGLPQLTFYVSSEQNDTDFLVTLHDVDQAGNTLYLQRGFLRASMRTVDNARSTRDELYFPLQKPQDLMPGQVYEMKLSLYPLGHVMRAGHVLELSILSPSPIPQPDWGLVPLALPGENTVYHSAQYPSRLSLPLIPGLKAQAPAPPCGTTQFQPCRRAPTDTSDRTEVR